VLIVRRGRPISIHLHGALELLVGAALIALPFVTGLATSAAAFSVVIGALVLGLGLTASEPGARGSIPLTAHAAYDLGLGLGLVGAGLAFGAIDGYRPLAFFLTAGALELMLATVTRYAPSRV
jgi:hypothetical protein